MLLITAGYQLHSGFLCVIWETDTALVDTDYLKLQRSFFNVAKYYTIGAFSQKKKKIWLLEGMLQTCWLLP